MVDQPIRFTYIATCIDTPDAPPSYRFLCLTYLRPAGQLDIYPIKAFTNPPPSLGEKFFSIFYRGTSSIVGFLGIAIAISTPGSTPVRR